MMAFADDRGKSSKPARVLLIGTHADLAPAGRTAKNAVGETTSREADAVLGRVLDRFGNFFSIHPRVFLMDANVANSQDMRALKQTLTDIKTEIIDVRFTSKNGQLDIIADCLRFAGPRGEADQRLGRERRHHAGRLKGSVLHSGHATRIGKQGNQRTNPMR